MLRKNKKKKDRRPTEQEFLRFIPVRLDIKWEEDSEGIVKLTVPKFESKFGKSFCKLIKKDNHFTANLDKLGSIVWKNCDGKKTVEDILKILEKEFSDEKDINQRLYLFLQQLQNLGYITFK